MSAKVGTIAGTWGHAGEGSYAWWKPGSVFIANLKAAGLDVVSDGDFFDWSTALDGVSGHNDDWETSGKALYWFWVAHGRGPLSLIAHSHGAQVVAYALAYSAAVSDPMRLEHLVTAGSPVRGDMQSTWSQVRPLIADWTHLYTDELIRPPSDLPYQELGSLPILPSFPFTRLMPQATRNIEVIPATTHHGLVWPKLWLDHNLSQYLKDA